MYKRLLTFFTVIIGLGVFVAQAQDKVIYPYPMNPTEHPDYLRHHVKAPDMSLFGNKIQFMSLRNLGTPDYKEKMTQYVEKDKLGNIIWPRYTMLFQDNFEEIIQEIKKRNLYLFTIWGYIPGSGPGGPHQQFIIPEEKLKYIEKELGDRWMGMDNGEQDGRYVGSFAPRFYPMASDRKHQYFNFQRHFEALGTLNGNKLGALVSLNFGHYYLKEGIYTMIGAETAQGLPNAQIYYSFLRGAGKQYGVHWYGNTSVWNRWGHKKYVEPFNDDDTVYAGGSPRKGTSLSLLKRLIYTQLCYNCATVGFESGLYAEGKLSPIGHIQQNAVRWYDKHSNTGTMYTPVAFLLDFFSGWSFPRHIYADGSKDLYHNSSLNMKNAYRVWGNIPYEAGDYLTDNMLNILYPGYQDASYYHDERGFMTPTPYGDMADCLLSDAPLWLLKQYPLLVVANQLESGMETKDKLESYVKEGGHLVITAGSLKNIPDGMFGISVSEASPTITSKYVQYGAEKIQENDSFALAHLNLPTRVEIIQNCGTEPAVVELNVGKGKISVIASPFGISEHPQCSFPVDIKEDEPLAKPYPMLKHVQSYMEDLFAQQTLFETNPELSVVTCAKNENEYTVLLTNSNWTALPFTIKSNIGEIASIDELKIKDDEIKALGYTPKVITGSVGKNTSKMIAGGGTRAFKIRVKDSSVRQLPKVESTPNVTDRALVLHDVRNLKEEILSRPTFFQHYDRAVIDWRYVEEKEKTTLSDESVWFNLQKLKISVDLTSGINLYPDLRIVNNHAEFYDKSISRIKNVIDKMGLMGADELIITSMRPIENNFTPEKFEKSLIETFQMLSDYAKDKNIRLLYRPAFGRIGSGVAESISITEQVARTNFELAPSVSLLLEDTQNLDENIALLKKYGIKNLIVAAPQKDIYSQICNLNVPIYKYGNQNSFSKIMSAFPGCRIIMDGLYNSVDEEYLDVKCIDSIK